jgi:hypothetical protein
MTEANDRLIVTGTRFLRGFMLAPVLDQGR